VEAGSPWRSPLAAFGILGIVAVGLVAGRRWVRRRNRGT
jgi:hypothetical protein